MPLNNSYDEQAVVQAIASALETFYGTLIEKIDGLNIQKVMNPQFQLHSAWLFNAKIRIYIVQKPCRVQLKLWIQYLQPL